MKKGLGNASKRPLHSGAANHPSQPAMDLIALGSKPKDGRSLGNDSSRLPPLKKSRQLSTTSSLLSNHRFSGALEPPVSRMSPVIPDSNAPCIDCPPDDLVYRVEKYLDANKEQVEGLLCGAIKNLRRNRIKPDTTIVLSILYLAKAYPKIFNTENIIESLCGLLKRDIGLDYSKSKTNNIIAIVACSLLMKVLEKETEWPILIIQVFLDDSFSDRIWVDHIDCQPFVKNIVTAFGTRVSKKEDADSTELNDVSCDEVFSARFTAKLKEVQNIAMDVIKDRLSRRQTDMASVSIVQNQASVGAAQQLKHLIQTLTSACGMQEIRTTAVQKLDMWLQNIKIAKPAQDLLHAICVNCSTHSQEDVDVIGALTKLRLKSKVQLNQYLLSIKELIEAHSDNLKTLLSYVLYNELSNARNQSNMAVIAAVLQHHPEAASKTLASVCQDLLLQQEDYCRHVRSLLREIVRSVKHEIQFTSLALGLMQEPDMEKYMLLDQSHKERYIASTCDLICLTMLLSLTPQAKEAVNIANGKKKAADSFVSNPDAVYVKFKTTVAEIQHDALWWVEFIVMPRLTANMTPNPSYFLQLIYKLLFLRASDAYHTRDNWPPESERSFMTKACHDVPVREDTLLRIAAMGISQDNAIAAADALELINQLVKRAAPLVRADLNPISANRVDFIDTLLSMCQYHHPSNIALPTDYVPPSLAISSLYWGALQCLLIVISLNPATLGHQAWTQYPIIKVLMEMAMVNRFSYPPVTLVDDEVRNQMIGKELQMALLEKSEILEFESHLAAATTQLVVTEESSLLLSQVMAMDPQGHPRRPPDKFLEQLTAISNRYQLSYWLCRSRHPDFLREVMNRHGEDQSMSWLPDLVSSSKSEISFLPVQCLCEFLLIHDSELEKLSSSGIHINELVLQLRKFLTAENLDEPVQVIQYFLKRLHSPQSSMRARARKALTMVLSNEADDAMEEDRQEVTFKWLLQDFIQVPHYATVIRPRAIEAIHHAVMVESDPLCLTAYVKFLSNDLGHFENLSTPEELYEKSTLYARMTAHLLIERRIVVDAALSLTNNKLLNSDDVSAAEGLCLSMLEIFLSHLRFARDRDMRRRLESNEGDRDGVPWSDSQDEIYVKWPNNSEAATLHIYIPQASIVLLGYGPPSRFSRSLDPTTYQHDKLYNNLMNVWFSEEGYLIPQAFLLDTQEEALLIPDWLRLRMLRSEVMPVTRRLAFAAVRELEVEQIILFVQSFGIPVESMNLLLEILDLQCEANSEVILNATSGNGNYMSRLLEVQKMRGCKAGSKVAALLKSFSDEAQQKAPTSCVIDLRDDDDESDVAMEVDSSGPSSYKFSSVSETRLMLLQFFSADAGNAGGFWANLLHSITSKNTRSTQSAQVCIEALHTLLFTDRSVDFISFLYNSPSRACSLLRALDRVINPIKMKSRKQTFISYKEIIDHVHEKGQKVIEKLGLKSSPLYLFSALWRSRNSSAAGEKPRRMSSTSEQSDNLRQSDWSKLEEFLKNQLAFLDKDNEIRAKVDLVAQILLEEISHRRTQMSLGKIHYNNVCFTSIGTTGLLVDWLQLLDPELLARTPALQRKLLFASGRNDFCDYTTPVFDQAYLLSLLAEHCNWSNIHSCLKWLLSEATPDPTNETNSQQSGIMVDPKTALDFVWVVMQAPKIWKGRENKSSCLNEPVIRLTTAQFSRLLSYVVAATANQNVNTHSSDSEGSYIDLFNFYFSKFGQSSRSNQDLCSIVAYLKQKIDSSSPFSPYPAIWWQLLAQLYVIRPNLQIWDLILCVDDAENGFSQSEVEKFSDVVSRVDTGCDCSTDALVCSLLNRLGYVRSKSSAETRIMSSVQLASHDSACDANLSLSKMSCSRPLLILRQVSLLSSMLQGRTRHDFFEFKMQHHLPLMVNAIGILRHLAPYVFRPIHEESLFSIMEVFWQMIRNYCHRARRQMLPVLLKTISFTHDYLKLSPNRAAKLLSEYQPTFQVLLKTYGDQEAITSTVSSLQSSVYRWTSTANSSDFAVTGVRAAFMPDNIMTEFHKEKASPLYLELLAEDQDLENITQVLADFDESSKRRIDNIGPYMSHLCAIFARSRDPAARLAAFAAALRHAHSSPKCAESDIFPVYLNCLRELNTVNKLSGSRKSADQLSVSLLGDSASASRDLVQFLPEICVLCRENAIQLLGAAFDAGLRNGAAFSYPKSLAGETLSGCGSENITNLLARALWLLCGLDESDVKFGS